MRKKYRDIVVDDVVYAWGTRDWPFDEQLELKIWLKTRGKMPWCVLVVEYTEGPITPKRVKDLIVKLRYHPVARSCLIDSKTTFQSTLSEL